MYSYKCKGTCSQQINFDLKDGKIYNCEIIGGCNGNTKGICKLVEGQDAQEIIGRLAGITCGYKPSSCPDQLSRALTLALEKEGSKE